MDSTLSASDVALLGNGNGFGNGNSFLWIFALLILANGGLWGNRGDYSQYATAASQNEILMGQKFDALDNKMDRGFTSIGNGISDATYALNNAIVNEGRAIQTQLCAINSNIDNKFAALEKSQLEQRIADQASQINQLQIAQQMANVVRYPNGWTYNAGTSPFCNCSGCGNI